MSVNVEEIKPKTAKISGAGLRRMFAFAVPYRRYLVGAFAMMLIGSGLNLILPAFAGLLIDNIVGNKDFTALNNLALIAIGVFLLLAVVAYFQRFFVSYAGERVVNDVRQKLYSHLQTLSLGFFNEQRSGDLMSRVLSDTTVIRAAVTVQAIAFFQSIITLIGGIFIVVLRDFRLVLLLMAIMPVVFGIAIFFGRRVKRLSNKISTELGMAGGTIGEALANQKTVKAFTNEAYEVKRFDGHLGKMLGMAMRLVRFESLFGAIMTFVAFSALIVVLWYGGNEVLNGRLTAGELVSTLIYMTIITGPIAQLTGLYSEFQRALGSAERIFEILDTTPNVTDVSNAPLLPLVKGHLRFEKVDFAYTGEQMVLKQLSFEALPGQVVALIGASGAGKTTIANLIPRFFDPVAGRITLDGIDIKNIQQASLRAQIGIVPQEPVLFGGSARENIAYGKLDATPAEIDRAAKAANAYEFIEKLPDGYDTLVGERGIKLSGGQRQRVAIARAILRDPRLLILDEATSSLDNESEALVQEALERLMFNRTTIVIAHRLTTIERADKIVVIETGQVVEEGTHAELLAQRGVYHRYYTRNFEREEINSLT
jgi:ATP-binding cassette, subfamily B, bacterial MsbA